MSVLLFASYADAFGARRLDVPVAAPCRARELVDTMRTMPGGSRLPAVPLVAVNRVWVDLESDIGPGDEVALIPPVAGG
jgi:molybdopterin converting factor small subunit